MRLVTLRDEGRTTAARVEGDDVVELPFEDVGALLSAAADEAGDWQELARRDGPTRPRHASRLAPVVVDPAKIFCVGLNYASHIREMGRDTPTHPTLFAKFASALTGPADPLVLPASSRRVDWEGELAVVIGRPVRHASRDEAWAAIAGYAVINDVTMRDWQRRTSQFLQGKTFERSSPFGPELVSLDEIDDPRDLPIRCHVDDEAKQSSRTSDLIFDPADLIGYISVICTLMPGDVIATGTPGGVGDAHDPGVYLQPGQTLRTEVEGIGTLVNECVAERP